MKFKKLLSAVTATVAAASSAFCAISCGGTQSENATPKNTDKYNIPQDNCRTYYEVFVRSFSDGNGDGIGDLRGLINNLDYLNDGDDSTTTDLGINGIWLMPIMPSPSYHKYDVINYYSIDSQYGTMQDFEELIDECNKRNIWVQIDLVLNHTSTQHRWFKAAAEAAKSGADPTTDEDMQYYTFVKADEDPDLTDPESQNSANSSNRWHPVPDAEGYWYLGNFDSSMPDVNLDNKAVRDEIENIVDFWLGKGVRSFRLDAVPYAYANNAHDFGTENENFWTWFNTMCEQKGEEYYGAAPSKSGDKTVADALDRRCYNVGEMLTDNEIIEHYFSTGMTGFNYSWGATADAGFLNYASIDRNSAYAYSYASQLKAVQAGAREQYPGALLSNFLSNHDNDRSSSLIGSDKSRIKKAAALYLLAPGNPYIYYGEELGAAGERELNISTDANRRMAFNWGSKSKGICDDPPGTTYSEKQPFASWASQTKDADSILTFYRNAIKLRNRFPEIGRGVIEAYAADANGKLGVADVILEESGEQYLDYVFADNEFIVAYTLTYKDKQVLIVHNIGKTTVNLDTSAFEGYTLQGSLKTAKGSASLKGTALTMGAGSVALLALPEAQAETE